VFLGKNWEEMKFLQCGEALFFCAENFPHLESTASNLGRNSHWPRGAWHHGNGLGAIEI